MAATAKYESGQLTPEDFEKVIVDPQIIALQSALLLRVLKFKRDHKDRTSELNPNEREMIEIGEAICTRVLAIQGAS
jgi:hypothetical protein